MGEIAVVKAERFPAAARWWNEMDMAALLPDLSKARLIPEAELPAVISDVERALQVPTPEAAQDATKLMLGCYPRHNIDDPEVWTRAMVAVFEDYPASIAYRAVDQLTRRLKFVPTRADLVEELEKLARALHNARAMALAMQREHKRRADDREMEAKIAADKKAFQLKHGDRPVLEVIREAALAKMGTEK